jgi:hypothetical protein
VEEGIPFHWWFYWVDKRISELAKIQRPKKRQEKGIIFKLRNLL